MAHLVSEYRAAGLKVPPELLERPAVPEHLLFYWSAFWELSSDRSFGMGMGPIPHSSISQYAAGRNLDNDMTDKFTAIIRNMDGGYRESMQASDGGATDPAGISQVIKRNGKKRD